MEEIGFLYQEALSAATEADDPEIVERAQHLLDSAKKVDTQSMLYAAYKVLSEAPDPDYTTPIFQTLPFADTSFVLEAAFALLEQCIVPEDDAALRQVVKHLEPSMRAASLALLADADLAEEMVDDEEGLVRLVACRVLANTAGRKVAGEVLLDLMEDENPEVRTEAVTLLPMTLN